MAKSRILAKLKVLGSPAAMAEMFMVAKKFIATHRYDYPKPDNWDKSVYVEYAGEPYLFLHRELRETDAIPAEAAVLVLSEAGAQALAKLVDTDPAKPAVLLRKLLRVENIKRYRELLAAVDTEFKTNMTFMELSVLIKK